MKSRRGLVYRAAELARCHVEKFATSGDGWSISPSDLRGGCAAASYITWKALKKLGVEAHLVIGKFEGDATHAWVEFRGKIYDATATQFGMPGPVYVTPAADPDYGPCDCSEPPDKHRDADAVVTLAGWDDCQSPIDGDDPMCKSFKSVSDAIEEVVAALKSGRR